MGGLFERSDANKDGVVTKAEFDASTSQMRTRMEARLEKASMQRPGSRMFQIADTNKDGKVALAEVQQIAGQRFDRLDLNHDGRLTPEERKQARQQKGTAHRPS
jgi:Ca2+-binding EF-hand superfamily protein